MLRPILKYLDIIKKKTSNKISHKQSKKNKTTDKAGWLCQIKKKAKIRYIYKARKIRVKDNYYAKFDLIY